MSMSPAFTAKLLAKRKQEMTVAITPDIYPWYRQMLAQRIVYDERRGAWMVFRYADVGQVLLDVGSFSSQRTLKPDGSVDEIAGAGMLGTDPPRHRHLRSLVIQAFTQKRVAQLEPRIRAIATQLLDEMTQTDTPDLVAGFAFPLPVMVIAELLGVPAHDALQFRQWAIDFVGNDYELRMQTARAISGYFNALISERAQRPRQDLISELLGAEVNGESMTRSDLIGACLLLLIAGHETTATLIGNAMWCFDEHPEAWQQILADPALLPGAIEEVLRFRAVVHYLPRVVKQDMRFMDQDLEAGDLMLPMFAAANLDPEQFPHPDRFDIRRTPNRHLGFGFGIHLCLGATLARLEARVGLGQLMARFPRAQRDRSQPLELRQSAFVYSLKSYPIYLQG
jgi:cytochrome P450